MCHLTHNKDSLAIGDVSIVTNPCNDCATQAMPSLMEVMMKHVRESAGEMLQ
jgi:hypothetical protein